MRFGISVPQLVAANGFDRGFFSAFLRRAEALGFESAWVQEQLIGPAPLLSPLAALSYAASCTEQIRLGCAVLVTPLHSPVHLARELASVDQLSSGRLEVGVVAGGRGRPYAAFGLSPEGAIARFNEGLALLKALWTEPEVTQAGRFWQLDGATMGLKPVQRPHPPLWLGGSHPDALRRAVRHGQGFIGAGSQTTARFAEQVRVVNDELRASGVASFRIAKRVYVCLDDDADRARSRMGDVLRVLYPRLSVDQALAFTVTGGPDAVVEGLRAVVDAGAELIVLTLPHDEALQMERLASEVLPRVSAT